MRAFEFRSYSRRNTTCFLEERLDIAVLILPSCNSLSLPAVEKSVERTQRTFIRLFLGIGLGLVLLVAAIWGGHGAYIRWQEKRLVRRATIDIEKGDLRDASVAARSILQMRPDSPAAARVLAELAEHDGNRAELEWRRRVSEAVPDSVDDALALVRAAIKYNDIPTAERTLAGVSEKARSTAAYHEAAALVAQSKEQDAKANEEWREALRLRPDDTSLQLQWAMLRVRSAEPQEQAEAEAMLEKLRSDRNQRAAATRALIKARVARRENSQKIIGLTRELQEYPEATFIDRLQYLDFLHQVEDPAFSSYLDRIEQDVATDSAKCGQLLSWMSQHNLNLLALDFVKRIPPEILAKWPMPLAQADIYAHLRDWSDLEKFVSRSSWAEAEFMRHAYFALALRGQGKPFSAEWSAAITAASRQTDSLSGLVRVTSDWKWEDEMVELLWILANKPEKQKETTETLYSYYIKKNDSQGLYRVLVRWAEKQPDDLDVQNNLAQISLLLGANVTEARRIAADLYRKKPDNPAYATTYAYSLLTSGNAKEAARIMNSLTAEQLRDPSVGAYYGICLAALRDQKARAFLEAGQQAPLLPEEKELVDKALASLESPRRAQ